MRTMLFINGQTETMEIYHLIARCDNSIYIPATPYRLPIIIQDVRNPFHIVERLNTCGWADLSMFHAEYIDKSQYNLQADANGGEREIEYLEFER